MHEKIGKNPVGEIKKKIEIGNKTNTENNTGKIIKINTMLLTSDFRKMDSPLASTSHDS